MNDQLLMENYLLVLKSTVEVYVHGTLESTSNDTRETLKFGLNEILQHQADTYDNMTKFGWYTVNNVETSKISQTIQTINSKN